MRQIYLLKQKLEPQRDDSRPVISPNCGCEKVYRNGTYEIRPKGFFDNLKTRKEELIQRFICSYCKKSFHIKKQNFPHSSLKNEVRRSVGILRTDGKTYLRSLQDCIRKVLCVDVSLGFIYKELTRISQIAERINLKVSSLEGKKGKFFYSYMVRIKKRFNALYELEDAGEINSSKG